MSLTYTEMLQRRSREDLFYVTIVVSDLDGNTETIRVSDHGLEIGDDSSATFYDGIILDWDTIISGNAEPWNDAYSMQTVRISIAVDRVGDQELGHNLIDILTAYELIGATVTITHRIGETNLTASPLEQQRFSGRVFDIPADGIRPDRIELQARGEVASDTLACRILRRGQFTDMIEGRGNAAIPFIVGRIGFYYQRFTDGKTNTSAVANSTWRHLCLSQNATPAELESTSSLVVAVASNQVESGDVTPMSGALEPVLIWDDDDSPAIFEDLVPGDFSESGGTFTIPTLTSSDYNSRAHDGDVALRKFDMPNPEPVDPSLTSGLSSSSANWTNPENAFTRDIDTYAEIVNDASGLGTKGATQAFLRHPPWHYRTTEWGGNFPDSTDGAEHYVYALIWTSGGYDITVELVDQGGTSHSYTYTGSTQLSEGYYFVGFELNDTAVDRSIDHVGWGDAGNEGIEIRQVTPSSGDTLRVYMFGISYVELVKGESLFTQEWTRVVGYSGDLGSSKVKPPRLYYVGYGGALTTVTGRPSEVIIRLLREGSEDSEDAIGAGDIDTTDTAAFLTAYDSGLDVSGSNAEICVVETNPSATLGSMIAEFKRANFCHVWKSGQDNKWHVRLRPGEAPASGDGQVLYRWNLVGKETDAIRMGYTPQQNIQNAVYIDFDWDGPTGEYRKSVYIDNTTEGSQDYDGSSDATMEALAESSQSIYGRREVRIQTKYHQDALTAWSCAKRRIQLLSRPRVMIDVICDREFAGALEEASIFETDTSLDDVCRLPLRSETSPYAGTEWEPSWDGQKWWVCRVTEAPRGAFVVRAVHLP